MDFEKTYRIPFPPEAVYAAWVSEQTVIPPASRMEIRAEVGGVYELVMPGDVVMNGVFQEVEPHRRLRYSWQWSGDDEKTEVEVGFEVHAGGSSVTVAHRGFTSSASLATHSSGWDSYLAGLEDHLRASGQALE